MKTKQEKVRNITIELGYANAKIYKCPACPAPDCYASYGSDKEDEAECQKCKAKMALVRHVSFVDCPGHEIYMATMVAGAAVMDAAFLLIAANVSCPQPQTSEHLAAVEIMKLKHIIILQNKVDLIVSQPASIRENFEQIKAFISPSIAKNSPIIPVSAQFKLNIDALVQHIAEYIPVPIREMASKPQMIVIRSFDVNKPGFEIDELKGGVAGGSILRGTLRVGDRIEIRPGQVIKDSRTGALTCKPIHSKIITLLSEANPLLYAIPGGLIAVGTTIDPALTRQNKLVGNIIGYPDQLSEVYDSIEIKFSLLNRLVGVKAEAHSTSEIDKLKTGETLLLNIGSTSTGGTVIATVLKQSLVRVALQNPVCSGIGEKVSISRKIDKNYRLIGWGSISSGHVIYK